MEPTLQGFLDFHGETIKTQYDLYIESLNALAEDFLVRNDKLGMAFSMEGRFPILNKRLRDYVRALPSELKIDIDFAKKPKNKHKYLQKKAYQGLLPKYILDPD